MLLCVRYFIYIYFREIKLFETESKHLRDWHLYFSAVFWRRGTTCMLEETGLLPISEKIFQK